MAMYNFLMPDIFLILAAIISGFAVTLYFIRRWTKPDTTVTSWLQSSAHELNQRLDYSAQLMASVQKNLGEMSEIGRGMKSLQDFLQSPKLRGGLGEEVLKEMIGQTFPKTAFFLQYSFKSGVKVDAALKTDAGLLCIDSKFPLENFKALVNGESVAKTAFVSDIKKHILDISQKYILPDEGTLDFALMYIPSEAVYYEVVNIAEISQLARKYRVYPVSPNTLYAHLQVLLLSFQGKQLESQTKEVWELLRAIQKDYSKVEDNLGVLSRHVTNASNQMINVSQSFGSLGQKISKTHHLNDSQNDAIKQLDP
jgi:DNA recombination protein RmuC